MSEIHYPLKNTEEIVEAIDNAVNTSAFNPYQVANQMQISMHRYTQSRFFDFVLWFLFKLADNYEKGSYDGRNESACKIAWRIVNLIKNEGSEFDNCPELWGVCKSYESLSQR